MNVSIFNHRVQLFIISAVMIHQRCLVLVVYVNLFFSQVLIILSFNFFSVESYMGMLQAQRIQLAISKYPVSH